MRFIPDKFRVATLQEKLDQKSKLAYVLCSSVQKLSVIVRHTNLQVPATN
jgi:hypothetical protein